VEGETFAAEDEQGRELRLQRGEDFADAGFLLAAGKGVLGRREGGGGTSGAFVKGAAFLSFQAVEGQTESGAVQPSGEIAVDGGGFRCNFQNASDASSSADAVSPTTR
jgi:hypothetical protein